MIIEMTPQETDLLRMLLAKEREDVRVELHHAKNIDFKGHLRIREQLIHELQERIEVQIAVGTERR